MISDIIKKYKNTTNFQILLVFLLGYFTVIYATIFFEIINTYIPYTIITFSYFFLAAILLKKYAFAFFLCISLFFISIYFSVLECGMFSFDCFLTGLNSYRFAILAYNFLLIPISFLGISIDYFALSKELQGVFKIPILGYMIAILIKKNLITHRYETIMNAFHARGLNTKSFWNRYTLMPKWVIPLVVTTLMEGLESHDYNVMLKTDVKHLNVAKKRNIKMYQYVFTATLLLLIIAGIFLWINM